MKSYGLDCIGSFKFQRVSTLPTWSSEYTGRALFVISEGKYYFGGVSAWLEVGIVSNAGTVNYLSSAYPEILTSTNTLALTLATGQIVINTGQSFKMRDSVNFNTTDFSAASRTFATTANLTYHLRFVLSTAANHDNFGNSFYSGRSITNGMFYLVNATDISYNSSGLVETNSAFDSKRDDMLIARIVTDSGNVPAATLLTNMNHLYYSTTYSGSLPNSLSWTVWTSFVPSFNWARIPKIATPSLQLVRHINSEPNGTAFNPNVGVLATIGIRMTSNSLSRYGCTLDYVYDDSASNNGWVQAAMIAMA